MGPDLSAGMPKSRTAVAIMPMFWMGCVSAPSSQQIWRTRARAQGSVGSRAGPPASEGSSSMYSTMAAAWVRNLRSAPLPMARAGTRPSGLMVRYSTRPLPSSASTAYPLPSPPPAAASAPVRHVGRQAGGGKAA